MNQQAYHKGMGRSIFGNLALVTCYNECDNYADQSVAYLTVTKNQAVKYINEQIPLIHVYETEATFMLWLDCRRLGFVTQKELMDFMFCRAKVLLSDGTEFGEKEGFGFVRFNFAVPRAMVMEGLRRIKDAVNNSNFPHL